MFDSLQLIGVDRRDRRLIKNLYMDQIIKVRLLDEKANDGRGIRQGCNLSPTLFNVYGDFLTEEALHDKRNLKIGGEIIKTIKYADDQVIMAKDEVKLQEMIDRMIDVGKNY